ncbi:cysteine proteinase [Panus rudis PR-1116 ss-1]|nr:cysteine proteinase [Panus rudis PR-1116 ss-1]
MLATPLYPHSSLQEDRDVSQYRPAKDIEAFNKLLPPPIEFVEGSSSGTLVLGEGKYQPINAGPSTLENDNGVAAPRLSEVKDSKDLKSLYPGTIDLSWPKQLVMGCGLNNIGNTCFLNSALQCMLHTPPLLHMLLRHNVEEPCRAKKKKTFCMSCEMKILMNDCYANGRRLTTPYVITNNLSHIAKHMRRGRQEDSHEFLRYAIDALQRSCLLGYPPKLDHKLQETTWVHKIFGGRLRSRVSCLSCGYNSDTFDSMLDLSVDIYGMHSLQEALRKFVAVDHLKGSDKYKCEKCKKHVNADKRFTVHEAPLVLNVHLKRFSPMGRKLGQPIRYEETLSLKPVMSEGQFGPTYNLYGVICHAGGGPNSGHYYAFVKNAQGRWFEMNDESVTPQYGAPTGLKNAYILFYIQNRGQDSDSSSSPVSRPSLLASPQIPKKGGIVANMKKRKIVESDDEADSPSTSPNTTAPFIGPRLPSPPSSSKQGEDIPSSPSTPKKKKPNSSDPQAELLKKKISAATAPKPAPSNALLSLAQYTDDDSDDVGQKVEDKVEDNSAEVTKKPGVEASGQPPHIPSQLAAPEDAVSPLIDNTTLPDSPNPSSSKLSPVPTSSFYSTSNKRKGKSRSTDVASLKRKLQELDEEDLGAWVRTPISPASSSSGAGYRGANPYNRLKSGNNLFDARDSRRDSPLMRKYGKGKKLSRAI